MQDAALASDTEGAHLEHESAASMRAGITVRLVLASGVTAAVVGVAALVRLMFERGWLWFIAAPFHTVAVSSWLAAAAALTWWSRGRCGGGWRLIATWGLALIGATTVACAVVLVGGSARLIYRLVTADI